MAACDRKSKINYFRGASTTEKPNLDSDSCRSSCVRVRSKGKQPVDMGKKSRKKRKVERGLDVEPKQMIPPEWLLDVMRREENGYNPKLISTRKLFASDLNKQKARLSVPFLQVHNPDFLTEQERIHIHENAIELREEGVSVDLVDPNMKKHALDLRKWNMNGNWYYSFCKDWNHVLEANKSFEVNDVYPLWSFRSGNGKLCFALVPSDQETSSSHGGGSTSGESGRDGASTSGESAQIPLPVNHPSPPAGKRDSSHSSQGCSGESSSRSS
ncbi:PREDICTED: putative B3 domain-containing protein At2g27410 [Camelina sativa]|uniref:B3 domain-containing protein At2g27410 n=1 Tax=Camelina sativa TaxID=90675 RepID=A0ABM0SP09_CAMSA|nr:PREDICTED: putative B3 domain-containing protein At2g27410 [Camelina sativa]